MFKRGTPAAILLMRLFVGLNFVFAHGLGKVSNPEAFLHGNGVGRFPVPVVFGTLAMLSEFVGGTLLTLGLWTRVAALFILGTMLGASLVVHGADPWARKELAVAYAVMALFFLAHGGGEFSVDRLIRGKRK